MKKMGLVVLMALTFFHLKAQNSLTYTEQLSFDNPATYTNYVWQLFMIADSQWVKTMETPDLKKALKENKKLKNISGKILSSLKKMDAYDNNTNLQTASINLVSFMNRLSKKENPEMLRLMHSKYSIDNGQLSRLMHMASLISTESDSLYADIKMATALLIQKYGFSTPYFSETKVKTDDFSSAQAYQENIASLAQSVTDLWNSTIDANELQKALDNNAQLLKMTEEVIKSLEKTGPYMEDDQLRKIALNYVYFMNKISKSELPEFLGMTMKENVSDAENERIVQLLPILDDERTKLYDLIGVEQDAFAKKFNFTIQH